MTETHSSAQRVTDFLPRQQQFSTALRMPRRCAAAYTRTTLGLATQSMSVRVHALNLISLLQAFSMVLDLSQLDQRQKPTRRSCTKRHLPACRNLLPQSMLTCSRSSLRTLSSEVWKRQGRVTSLTHKADMVVEDTTKTSMTPVKYLERGQHLQHRRRSTDRTDQDRPTAMSAIMTAMMANHYGHKMQVSRSAEQLAAGVLHTLRGTRSLGGTSKPKPTAGTHQTRTLGTQPRRGRRRDMEVGRKSARDQSLELVLFVSPRPLAGYPSTLLHADVRNMVDLRSLDLSLDPIGQMI
jgi:hypothetical protein